ncbi:hypothetical protein CLAIMM_14625, partial [Cladophialophora immunda]
PGLRNTQALRLKNLACIHGRTRGRDTRMFTAGEIRPRARARRSGTYSGISSTFSRRQCVELGQQKNPLSFQRKKGVLTMVRWFSHHPLVSMSRFPRPLDLGGGRMPRGKEHWVKEKA